MQPVEATERSFWQSLREAVAGTSQDYTEVPLRRAIWLLSVPMVLEMCMESLFGIVDIFWLSKLGKHSMAAVALTESTMMILFAIAMGLSMGTTAIVSRRIGEKKMEEASVAASQSLFAGLAVSLVVSAIGAVFAPDLLALMHADPEVIRVGAGYTRTIYAGSVTIFLLFLLNAVFRGAGDASVAMRSLWLANAVNILLNPLLIFGIGPFPELGVTGSAVGTTIGRGCGVAFQLWMLFHGGGRVALSARHMRIDGEVMRRLIGLSASGAFQYLLPTASWTFMVRFAAEFGSASVAAYGLAIRIVIFVILPSWGLSNAAATLVGQNLGAGKPDRAETAAWRTGLYNTLFLGGVGLIFILFAEPIIRTFTADESVVPIAATALRIFSTGNMFYAYGMVLTQSFNGAGDTRTPTILTVIAYWLTQIPLAWALAFGMKLEQTGVFLAVVFSEGLLALMSIVLFRKGKWKEQKV